MINGGPNILQVVLMSYHEANACLSWRWHEHRQDFHRLGSVITTWLESAIKKAILHLESQSQPESSVHDVQPPDIICQGKLSSLKLFRFFQK
jgi:hypothetical protein